jgi:hypothetical protein
MVVDLYAELYALREKTTRTLRRSQELKREREKEKEEVKISRVNRIPPRLKKEIEKKEKKKEPVVYRTAGLGTAPANVRTETAPLLVKYEGLFKRIERPLAEKQQKLETKAVDPENIGWIGAGYYGLAKGAQFLRSAFTGATLPVRPVLIAEIGYSGYKLATDPAHREAAIREVKRDPFGLAVSIGGAYTGGYLAGKGVEYFGRRTGIYKPVDYEATFKYVKKDDGGLSSKAVKMQETPITDTFQPYQTRGSWGIKEAARTRGSFLKTRRGSAYLLPPATRQIPVYERLLVPKAVYPSLRSTYGLIGTTSILGTTSGLKPAEVIKDRQRYISERRKPIETTKPNIEEKMITDRTLITTTTVIPIQTVRPAVTHVQTQPVIQDQEVAQIQRQRLDQAVRQTPAFIFGEPKTGYIPRFVKPREIKAAALDRNVFGKIRFIESGLDIEISKKLRGIL